MFFHLGKRFKVFWLLKGKPGLLQEGKEENKRELDCYSLIQQMFIECLLCSRHVLGSGSTAMKKTNMAS